MYQFFQQVILFIIIEFLRLIEGINNIFDYLLGNINVSQTEVQKNYLDIIIESSFLNNAFDIIILISVVIGSFFIITSLIKNMITNTKSIGIIISKFFISIILVFIVSLTSLLLITVTNSAFLIFIDIFNIDNDLNLSYKILDICVIDYNNLYNIKDIDFDIHTVDILFGDYQYETYQLLPIGWKNNGYINPNTFLYIPCLITTSIVLFAYLYCAVKLVKRIYEIILLYCMMPISVFTITLDDGNRLKIWFSLFIRKVFMTFTIYFSLFLFNIIYKNIMNNYFYGNSYNTRILNLLFIIGGSLLLPISQKIFNLIFKDNSIINNAFKIKNVFKKNIDKLKGDIS